MYTFGEKINIEKLVCYKLTLGQFSFYVKNDTKQIIVSVYSLLIFNKLIRIFNIFINFEYHELILVFILMFHIKPELS